MAVTESVVGYNCVGGVNTVLEPQLAVACHRQEVCGQSKVRRLKFQVST